MSFSVSRLRSPKGLALIAVAGIVGLSMIGNASGAPASASASPTPTPAATGSTPTTTPAPTAPPSIAPTAPPQPTPTPEPTFGPTGASVTATVVEIVDGDTIKVDIAGQVATVRYIGIDTPETRKPGTPVQWMGPEATKANAALVDGRTVVLERDVSETDQFGRLLRDVWLEQDGGWLLVNLELVRQGFASVTTYPPDVKYEALLLPLQQEARDADRGLWAPEPTPAPTPKPTVKPTAKPAPKPTAEPASNCEPAYPDLCVPKAPPDLDCNWIYERGYDHITVLAPDPHNFDGNDNDGIGCESP